MTSEPNNDDSDCHTWTKEPEEAPLYSDWKVTIERSSGIDEAVTNNNNKSVTYAVHRILLGPKSEYFTRVFSSYAANDDTDGSSSNACSFLESKDQHSRIVLPHELSDEAFDWTTEAFEMLLTECYKQVYSPPKNPRAFVALYYLADYFQVHDNVLKRFEILLLQNLNSGESGELYEGVIEFQEAGLYSIGIHTTFAKYCFAAGFKSISAGTNLADAADVPLWLEIATLLSNIVPETNPTDALQTNLKKKKKKKVEVGEEWSKNIAYFLNRNDSHATLEVCEKITCVTCMPYIHPEAALIFLNLEQHRFQKDVINSVSKLQERCVDTLLVSHLELPANKDLQKKAISEMSKHPPVIELYVTQTLDCLYETKLASQNRQDELDAEIVELSEKVQAGEEEVHSLLSSSSRRGVLHDGGTRERVKQYFLQHGSENYYGAEIDDCIEALSDIEETDIRNAIEILLEEGFLYKPFIANHLKVVGSG